MSVFIQVRKNSYCDSIETFFATSVLGEIKGVDKAFVSMGTQVNKEMYLDLGMNDPSIIAATGNDLIIGVIAESEEVFNLAKNKLNDVLINNRNTSRKRETYPAIDAAIKKHPAANVCVISVPGAHVKVEAEKALNSGLHLIIFSDNVPTEDEIYIKELAREKGLLCMGPDCGVVNLNGIAFVLASINNRGPFGICGASGVGIQHVAALLHMAGSGISQALGTGGHDLKTAGGITMLMGIDALENDPKTEFIILISRKPEESTLNKVLERVAKCKKPVVAYFMGCSSERIEATGAIAAQNLDDTAQKALKLIGKQLDLGNNKELKRLAAEAALGMSREQKYVRGLYTGGTYCDEAMRTMSQMIGDIYSNCPLSPEYRLENSFVSVKNSVIDYGEEEFTVGRPHPVIDPSIRRPAIMREAVDPQVAVMLFDFILSPSAHMNPVGAIIEDIKAAMDAVKTRGGRLAVIASVCGTDADFQNRNEQEKILRNAGVLVCPTNNQAAELAGEIIRLKTGRN
jgi:FdrA protein